MTGRYAKGIVAAFSALLIVGNTALGPQFAGQLDARTSGIITLCVSIIGAFLTYLVPNSPDSGAVLTPQQVAVATVQPIVDQLALVVDHHAGNLAPVLQAILARVEPQTVTVTKDADPIDVEDVAASVMATLGPLVKAALARAVNPSEPTGAQLGHALNPQTPDNARGAQRVVPVGAVVAQERG